MAKNAETVTCELCERRIPRHDAVVAAAISEGVARLIEKDYPAWQRDGYVSREILLRYQAAYVADVLKAQRGEVSALEQEVIETIASQELVAEDVNAEFDKNLTVGKRVADAIATFGGSWPFIFIFGGLIGVWVFFNAAYILFKPFDPYPFILLNLFLSMLAAIQAPVIMMSQNRLEAKDRLRAEHDYKVNLKAELEVRKLHEKLDYFLEQQWERLLEMQQIQIELLQSLGPPPEAAKKPAARRPRK